DGVGIHRPPVVVGELACVVDLPLRGFRDLVDVLVVAFPRVDCGACECRIDAVFQSGLHCGGRRLYSWVGYRPAYTGRWLRPRDALDARCVAALLAAIVLDAGCRLAAMPGRPGRPRDADDAASVRILLRVTPQIRGILEDIARERHMRGVPQLVRSLIAD